MITSATTHASTLPLEEGFLAEVLSWNYTGFRYLIEAALHPGEEGGRICASGRFAMPRLSTKGAHVAFGEAAFSPCGRQLAEVSFAAAVRHNLIDVAADFPMETFRAQRLVQTLVLKCSYSIHSPIDPSRFYGQLRLNEVFRRPYDPLRTYFLHTHCTFVDDGSGFAEGCLLLACPRL